MKQFTVSEQQKPLIVEAIANKYTKDSLFHSDASYFPNHILCWQIEQASLANSVTFVPSPTSFSKSEADPNFDRFAQVKEKLGKLDL